MSSEELKYRPTQELVCDLTQYLIQSGAENYIEDSYTLTLDTGPQCDVVVTVQYTSQPTPHELRLQAEQDLDAARTKLAAIQGGMGDGVEVVAWRVTGAGGLTVTPEQPRWAESDPRLCIEPLMTVAQHQRITAAMAAEVERLYSELDRNSLMAFKLVQAEKERDALRAELAEVKGREAVQYQYLSRGENARWWNIEPSDVEQAMREGFAVRKLYTTPPASPDVEGLVKALECLLSWSDRQVCTHEETHRGGAIWEICDMCGAKWADDEGGKPEFKWPDEIEGARAALSTWRQAHTPSTLPASSAEE